LVSLRVINLVIDAVVVKVASFANATNELVSCGVMQT